MNISKPNVIIKKNSTPVIYLDTCLMIELSKHEQGRCTDKHEEEIGELYKKLLALMQSEKIICVLGNQMEEMGVAKDRHIARNFLYKFTNAEWFLPDKINSTQLDAGYNAFVNDSESILFKAGDFFEEKAYCLNSSIEIHVPVIYKDDKVQRIKESKKLLVAELNDMKATSKISPIYEKQLDTELKADFMVFRHNLEHVEDSIETFSRALDELAVIYGRVKIDPYNSSCDERIEAIRSHENFLLSNYHHRLPYVWIRSVLFTQLMQRPNKVKSGDNLDITWASAYLPFVDYAVTDISFCSLLKSSGLAEQYNTKVYDMNMLSLLLRDLEG